MSPRKSGAGRKHAQTEPELNFFADSSRIIIPSVAVHAVHTLLFTGAVCTFLRSLVDLITPACTHHLSTHRLFYVSIYSLMQSMYCSLTVWA